MTRPYDYEREHHKRKFKNSVVLIFVFLWVLIGVGAYVQAFKCTSELYTGGVARKIAMLLLAGLLGPLWWIFYFPLKGKGYCQLK